MIATELVPFAPLTAALTEIAPRILAEHYTPDCCIGATNIAIRVLRAFGFHSVPLVVSAHVSNTHLYERLKSGKFTGALEPGDWSVGIGYGLDHRRPDKHHAFDAHLVACRHDDATGGDTLIDLTLPQASRPEKGIVLEALAVDLPAQWRTDPMAVKVNDAYVVYKPLETSRDFRAAPDWLRPKNAFIASAIAAAIKRARNSR